MYLRVFLSGKNAANFLGNPDSLILFAIINPKCAFLSNIDSFVKA